MPRLLRPLSLLSAVLFIACARPAEPSPSPSARVTLRDSAEADPAMRSAPTDAIVVSPTLFQQEALVPVDAAAAVGDFDTLGDTLLAAQRAPEAIEAYRTALSFGASAPRWRRLGLAYMRAHDDARAERCLLEALAVDITDVEPRRALARLALAKGEGALARAHAQELVAALPGDVDAHRVLARAYLQTAMWQQAIDELERVTAARPNDIYAHNNLGYAALQLGHVDLALKHLERVLSLQPQAAFMFNNLGVAYERAGLRAQAHAAFTRASQLAPRYVAALTNHERLTLTLTELERQQSSDALVAMCSRPPDAGDAPSALSTDDADAHATERF